MAIAASAPVLPNQKNSVANSLDSLTPCKMIEIIHTYMCVCMHAYEHIGIVEV
jgi:hypothetical protein